MSGGHRSADDIDDLLDRADDAADRQAWDDVVELATSVLSIDADNIEAAGLLAKSERRRRAMQHKRAHGDGDRRTVTVMFMDLANFTALADTADPESIQDLLRWYHAQVGEAVADVGGHVARFMGDGAMAYFGYPRASEGAPQQAVHAGLDLIDRIEGRITDISRSYGVGIGVRVGIHTGLAVIAQMGAPGRLERDDIVGETPNIAARLEALAPSGAVCVSEATEALVKGYFETEDLGPQRLKGVSREIGVHRVVGRTGAATRLDTIDRSERTPLTGRGTETRQLERHTLDSETAGGRLVLLRGEAGVGKSRLLEWLLDNTGSRPTVRAACAPHTASSPFHPLRTAAVPEGWTHGLLPGESEFDPAMTSAAMRSAMLETAAHRILGDPNDPPQLAVIEDIHWADASTLEVLEFLAEHVASTHVLVVATLRPEIDAQWFHRSDSVHIVDVPPLANDGVASMTEHVAGRSTPSLVDWLVERTAGVPLYVEELLRALRESGELNTVLDSGTTPDSDIPMTLHGVLLGRLDRLGPARHTAQVAAIIGRTFDVGLLSRVATVDDDHLRRDLSDLTRAGLIERRSDGKMRFRHALIRDAAYDSMLKSNARHLHGAIADELSKDALTLDEQPETIADHLHAAGRLAEAFTLYEKAARSAAAGSGHAEAISHAESALQTVATLTDAGSTHLSADELRIRLLLGPSLIAARGYGSEDVARNYERADELCRDAPQSKERFDAARGLASYHLLTAQIHRAIELAEFALTTARRHHDPDEEVQGLAWLGTSRFFAADFDTARRDFDQTASMSTSGANDHIQRYGLDPWILSMSHQVWLLWLTGKADHANELCREMMQRAASLDHPWSTAHALNYELGLLIFNGDLERARALANRQIELSIDARLPHYEAYARIFRGRAEIDIDADGASAAILDGLDMRKTTGALLALPLHHGLLTEVHLRRGDVVSARLHVEAALSIATTSGELWWKPELLRLSALTATDARHRRTAFAEARALAAAWGAQTFVDRVDAVADSDP